MWKKNLFKSILHISDSIRASISLEDKPSSVFVLHKRKLAQCESERIQPKKILFKPSHIHDSWTRHGTF